MADRFLIDAETKECLQVLEPGQNVPEPADRWEIVEAQGGEVGMFWNGNGWKTFDEWCSKQRLRRDKFLSIHVDSINAVRWEAMSQEHRNAWTNYRQQLLDIPQQEGFPRVIEWPTKP